MAAIVLATGTAVACSRGAGESGGSGKVTLTFANWADAEVATQPGIRAITAAYEKTHSNVTIQSKPISVTDIGHQLVLAGE